MPQVLEECVASMTAKWSKDPKTRPTPRKDKDGKPQDAKTQAHAICTASLQKAGKMEDELTEIALESTGMTLMGVAVTNRPHLKGLPPVKIVEREVQGEKRKQLRIPLLLQGIFRHPKGDLVFNPRVFKHIAKNLGDNVIEQDVCIDSRHNPDWGALGWLGPGFPGTGLSEEDDILVAYADPTPAGEEKVEQKLFRYASAELRSNFQHPRIGDKLEAAKLSTDEIEVLSLAELAEEEVMPEDTPTSDEQVVQLSTELEAQQEHTKKLEERLAKLEEERVEAEKLEERLKLAERRLAESEERLALSDGEKYVALVDSIMTKAEHYRDEDGKGHPKLLLGTARSLLLMEPVKTGEGDDDVIKLEHEEDEEVTLAQTHKFYHDTIVYLLENLPGLVPTEPGTHAKDVSPAKGTEEEEEAKLEEEHKEFIKMTGGPAPANEED